MITSHTKKTVVLATSLAVARHQKRETIKGIE